MIIQFKILISICQLNTFIRKRLLVLRQPVTFNNRRGICSVQANLIENCSFFFSQITVLNSFLKDFVLFFHLLPDFSMWRRSMMRLRVRKAPQQPNPGRRTHPSQAKRKHCEVEPSPVRGRGKMQKNETGLFSTIKKFIRGNAVKVGLHLESQLLFSLCYNLILHCRNTHFILCRIKAVPRLHFVLIMWNGDSHIIGRCF